MSDTRLDEPFEYVTCCGKRYKVATRQQLEARVVQDIMMCNLERRPMGQMAWIAAYKGRGDDKNREVLDDILEQVGYYLKKESEIIDIWWAKHEIPSEIADLVMVFLAEDGIFVYSPEIYQATINYKTQAA